MQCCWLTVASDHFNTSSISESSAMTSPPLPRKRDGRREHTAGLLASAAYRIRLSHAQHPVKYQQHLEPTCRYSVNDHIELLTESSILSYGAAALACIQYTIPADPRDLAAI